MPVSFSNAAGSGPQLLSILFEPLGGGRDCGIGWRQSDNAIIYGFGAGPRPTHIMGAGLHVDGSLSKNSGTFSIDHPVLSNTTLIHSFIEGPRCDLIYSNRKQLSNGYAEVNIETECTANDSSMSPGTFVALCTNPRTFLQNNDTFDRVKGHVSGHMLFITCENSNSTATIDWQVIAERHDTFIKKWDKTDSNGLLILEHPKKEYFN